jgi:ubiquinone/menaquinone biosynthesis C-methylase UbiE
MNLYHRWYCGSQRWSHRLQSRLLPWALRGVMLGNHPLEIGPGPGRVTEQLATQVARLTSIEIDSRLASRLVSRWGGSHVRVVEGDATAMPFTDGEFSSAISLFMLHHVPTAALQDRLFRETLRVLEPGATFVGADSIPSLSWRAAHLSDTCAPVDPGSIEERLRSAGFEAINLRVVHGAFRFTARRPGGPAQSMSHQLEGARA